eukprot:jgi/Chrpa1/1312/Chrysochromulina_OHIO_Genome00010784-RA
MSSSYGWISESTILPKKPRQIEDVGKASMIDLRAAVFATEEGLNRPDAGELRRHERERRKAGPLGLASNSGVAKRSAADTAEGLNEAQRIKDALARKAEQYERIVRGEADVAVLSDGLVDFELKKLQTGAADRDGAYPEFAPPPGSQHQEASRLAWERTSHEELRRGARSSEAAEEHVASVAKRRAEDAAVRHETEQGRAAASEQKGKRQRALDDRRALLRLKQEERERVRDASEGPPEPPATSAAMVLPVDPPGAFGTYLPSGVGVRLNPVNPVALLTRMEERSPALSDALASGNPTLVEFYAPWCTSCKEAAPSMMRMQAHYQGRVNFVVVNGDDPRNLDLVRLFGVDGIPHLSLISSERKLAGTLVGAVPERGVEGSAMCTMRQFSTFDVLKFNNVNLDPLTETYNMSFYLQYLARWPEFCFTAEAPTRRAMGYILGKAESFQNEVNSWHGHVTAVTVPPEYRRLGMATQLMTMLEKQSERAKGFFVDLFLAIDMYTKFGYSLYRQVIGYYSGEEDAYDMRKALSRDVDRKSIIPLSKPVYPDELD